MADTHTHTKWKEKGSECSGCWRENQELCLHVLSSTLPLGSGPFRLKPSRSYLPVFVRRMMALAQHLKDASTAPTATASEGSLVSFECLLSSSNSCLWKLAASASLAIWVAKDREGRVGWGYSQSLAHTEAFTPWEWLAKAHLDSDRVD